MNSHPTTLHRDDIECWPTDMDGVLVHENDAIPGAAELLAGWESSGIPYLVLTNNSIFTARDLSARLRSSGLHVPEDRIWTSALATAAFLQQQVPGGSAFVIGEAGILAALHDAGFVTTETDPSRLPSPSFFSKDGVWVTGQVWSVNGGVVLRR